MTLTLVHGESLLNPLQSTRMTLTLKYSNSVESNGGGLIRSCVKQSEILPLGVTH